MSTAENTGMSTSINEGETTTETTTNEKVQFVSTKAFELSSPDSALDSTTVSLNPLGVQQVEMATERATSTLKDDTTQNDFTTFIQSHPTSVESEPATSTERHSSTQRETTLDVTDESSSARTPTSRESTKHDSTTEHQSHTSQQARTLIESTPDTTTEGEKHSTIVTSEETYTSDFNVEESSTLSRGSEELNTAMTILTTSLMKKDSSTMHTVTKKLATNNIPSFPSINVQTTGTDVVTTDEHHLTTGNLMTTGYTHQNPQPSISKQNDHSLDVLTSTSDVLISETSSTNTPLEGFTSTEAISITTEKRHGKETTQTVLLTEPVLTSTSDVLTLEITSTNAPLERFTSTEAISSTAEKIQGRETTHTVPVTDSPDPLGNDIGTEDGVATAGGNLKTIQATEGASTDPSTMDMAILYSEESSSTHVRPTTSSIKKQSTTISSYNDKTSSTSNQVQGSSTTPGPVSEESTVKVPVFTLALIDTGIYGMLTI